MMDVFSTLFSDAGGYLILAVIAITVIVPIALVGFALKKSKQ
jgi:hypothetical protein